MMDVLIVSPQEVLFNAKAERFIAPGEMGMFEVLPFHRPMVSLLLPGIMVVDQKVIPISRGVATINWNRVTAIIEPGDPA